MNEKSSKDDWKGDVRLIDRRKTWPFEPTPAEEIQGITRWKKIGAWVHLTKIDRDV